MAAAASTWTNIAHQAELVLVVHDLSRDAIATVISKIGSKSTIGELPASQTIPWAAFSVAADNSVSPNNLAVVKVDDRQTVMGCVVFLGLGEFFFP